MRRGERVQRWVRTIPFINDYQQMLLASLPRPGACVHFLDGQQPELSLGDAPTVREVAPRSNVETIDLAAVQRIPPRQPFGPEPEHTWCYFYQKASLARQQGDWETVGRLGDEAQAAGYSPNDPVEWMPFLEGYLNLGQDDQAAGLMAIVRDNEAQRRLLCDTLTESTGAYSSPDIYAQLVTGLCPVAP
jgi:hypothetical protein